MIKASYSVVSGKPTPLFVLQSGKQLSPLPKGNTMKSVPNSKTARLATLASFLLLIVLIITAATPNIQAQGNSRTFPETGKTVSGRFLEYWNQNGGLAQQGYPITNELQEVSETDGKLYTVQYFERAVFELHPEKARPFDVLLSLLGVFYYNERYPAGAPNQSASADNPRFFPETGFTIGGKFRAYWDAHGGLTQQGYPISNEFEEVSLIDGKTYRVQYFERAVFEYHPEYAGTPNDVLLSLLGVLFNGKKHSAGPTPTSAPAASPTTAAATSTTTPPPTSTAAPTATRTSIPQDNSGQYMFYNNTQGKAVIGKVDASGNYSDLKVAIASGAVGWTHIVPLGKGLLLWYNKNSGLTVLGYVSNDAIYSDIDNDTTLGAGWTNVVSAGNNMILYYKAGTGTGGTARVNPDGSISILKVYTTFNTGWTHIAGLDTGILVFYQRNSSTAATARVDADGNLVNLKTFTNWTTVWDRLVPGIQGRLLQYYTIDGRAVVSSFDETGAETVLARYPDASRGEPPLPNGWPFVVGGSNGTLLWYNDSSGNARTGRLGGDGSVTFYNTYTGSFTPWDIVVDIR